jgi:hypothetical protein
MKTRNQQNSVVVYRGAGFLEENFEGSSWKVRLGPVRDWLGWRRATNG